jgi:hypothetical protein
LVSSTCIAQPGLLNAAEEEEKQRSLEALLDKLAPTAREEAGTGTYLADLESGKAFSFPNYQLCLSGQEVCEPGVSARPSGHVRSFGLFHQGLGFWERTLLWVGGLVVNLTHPLRGQWVGTLQGGYPVRMAII